MDDKEKELIGKTFQDMLLSIDIIAEAVVHLKERVKNLEVCMVQIAKIQGSDGKIVHKN